MAYQPFKDESEITEVYKQIETIDPYCSSEPAFYKGYKKLAESWAKVALGDRRPDAFYSQTTNEQINSCPAEGCPARTKAESEKVSPWYLPDRESVATATIHGAALGIQ